MNHLNKIIAKKIVDSTVKDGRSLLLSVATQTTLWKRPKAMVGPIGKQLFDSMAEWKGKLPDDITELCNR